MKNPPKKTLRNKADALVQRLAEGQKCVGCGIEADAIHHFIHKEHSNNLRYDLRNFVPLCKKCHTLVHCRQDSILIYRLGKFIGKDLDYLEKQRRIRVQATKAFYEKAIKRLEEINQRG